MKLKQGLQKVENKKTQEGGVNREIITDLAVQQTQLLIAWLYRSKRLEIKLSVYLYSTEQYVRNINTQRTITDCTLLMSLKRHEYPSI